MEIHIDTNKDSKEEIRRSIRMLQAYVGDNISEYSDSSSSTQNSDFSVPDSDSSPGMFNMFGGDSNNKDNSDDTSRTYEDEEKEPETQRVQIVEY